MAKLKNHDNLLRNKKKCFLFALYNGILRGDIFHGFTFPCALFHSVTVLHTFSSVFTITYIFFGVYKSKSEICNECWHIVSSRVDSEFCFFPFTLNNVLVSKFSAIRQNNAQNNSIYPGHAVIMAIHKREGNHWHVSKEKQNDAVFTNYKKIECLAVSKKK